MEGNWRIPSARGAQVRLTSGSLGVMSMEASAPVRDGSLMIGQSIVTLDLVIALDRMRMNNFLMQAAARGIITMHSVHDLTFQGVGQGLDSVTGLAQAGDIEVPLSLSLSISGTELELTGSASMGSVHIPLPGIGTVEDFSFDVDAKVVLEPSARA